MQADAYPRALELHRMLKEGRTVNSTILAQRFEVSVRHAQRVVEYLRDRLKAPVEYDVHRRVLYYTDPSFELPQLIMSEGEAVALIVAHQALLSRQETPLGRHLLQGLQKLMALMPNSVSLQARDVLDWVSFVPHPARPVDATILEKVTMAAEQRKRIRIDYYGANGDRRDVREVDVYHITQRWGDWYAVGYCHLRAGHRTFALSRIRAIEVLDCSYEVPEAFDAKAYFHAAMGIEIGQPCEVVLVFDAFQSRWIRERQWHASQEMVQRADGGVRLRLLVGISTELKQWILSYGAHVRVEEPLELAREIAQEHARAASVGVQKKPVTRLLPPENAAQQVNEG